MKQGLDYFPLDVDVFENPKLFELQQRYGPLGEAVFLRLLCLVYKNGYYLEFGTPDRLAALLARMFDMKWIRGRDIRGAIECCVESGMFDTDLYRQGVLTSSRIQKQYRMASSRRAEKRDKYSLLDELLYTETSTKKSIEKDRKENESIAKQIEAGAGGLTLEEIEDDFHSHCPHLLDGGGAGGSKERNFLDLFRAGWTREDFQKLFARAGQSSFLSGGGARGWTASLTWLLRQENARKVLAGHYDDPTPQPTRNPPDTHTSYSIPAFETEALRRLLTEDSNLNNEQNFDNKGEIS